MLATLLTLLLAAPAMAAPKQAHNPATPAYFLDVPVAELQRDLRALETWRSGAVAAGPWSGFYWPNYLGGLAYRRHDNAFPRGNWGRSHGYSVARPSAQVSTDLFSPAEKYDVAMGISPEEVGSLTQRQWGLGKEEFASTGRVAIWQGICNGWAGASIFFPKPLHNVVVPSTRGNITFTPDDIEALGSLLWATGRFESVYAGLRCFREESELRGALGSRRMPWLGADRQRIEECFDTNPADWHLLITHMVGMKGKSFVIDYVNSNEVWNKPVIAYSYRYFAPDDERYTSSRLRDVLVPARDVRTGRHWRGRDVKSIVGVKMDVTLLFGTENEDLSRQEVRKVEYTYLLELDARGLIVGGEWVGDKYPDFAWKPRHGRLPESDGDLLVAALDPAIAGTTTGWRAPALAALNHGAPLPRFVQWLFEQSTR